ncbi:MAG TPA: DUF6569 family protein [Candidatus Methylomirabilis sp.]|nr:DUF6569 family protein [Candidatus Methylomirabilis sp.]
MLTLADIHPIARTFGSLLVGSPQRHGALTVFPLFTSALSAPRWVTLDDAGDRVRITEVDEAGAVHRLAVLNDAPHPLLLLGGEELIARQNRVLGTTVLVPARSRLTIPVSCVEHGRWSYRGPGLSSGDASLFASVRAKKAAWINRSIRSGRGHAGNQRALWDELASKAAEHQLDSPTGAMRDFCACFQNELAAARRALAPVAGQVGALVYLAGRWAGLDLLASPALFSRGWPRLAMGYAADALGAPPGCRSVDHVDGVLETLSRCRADVSLAVGLGTEHRFTSATVVGTALVAEDLVAHLMAFPGSTRQ